MSLCVSIYNRTVSVERSWPRLATVESDRQWYDVSPAPEIRFGMREGSNTPIHSRQLRRLQRCPHSSLDTENNWCNNSTSGVPDKPDYKVLNLHTTYWYRVEVFSVSPIVAYEFLSTVNDAERVGAGCLRRHQRCHHGGRRWTCAINCWTP